MLGEGSSLQHGGSRSQVGSCQLRGGGGCREAQAVGSLGWASQPSRLSKPWDQIVGSWPQREWLHLRRQLLGRGCPQTERQVTQHLPGTICRGPPLPVSLLSGLLLLPLHVLPTEVALRLSMAAGKLAQLIHPRLLRPLLRRWRRRQPPGEAPCIPVCLCPRLPCLQLLQHLSDPPQLCFPLPVNMRVKPCAQPEPPVLHFQKLLQLLQLRLARLLLPRWQHEGLLLLSGQGMCAKAAGRCCQGCPQG